MEEADWTGSDRLRHDLIARVIGEVGVRNSSVLEDLHAGTTPDSATGDYSDVKVVSPYGEIPWTALSRISDEEMKVLMKDVVDRIFTFLKYPEELSRLVGAAAWDTPRPHPQLLKTVRWVRQRRRASLNGPHPTAQGPAPGSAGPSIPTASL